MRILRPSAQQWSVLIVVFFSIGLFVDAPVAFARMNKKQIQTEYRTLLGRDPVSAELTNRATVQGSRGDLQKKLAALPERDRAIMALYKDLLARRPRPHELAAWKKDGTAWKAIQKNILTSAERKAALDDMYLNMVGRYPSDDERAASMHGDMTLERMRKTLMTSDERKTAIIDRFASVLWRAPDDAEMSFFLNTGQSLDFIGQNTQPAAHAGDDQSVANDVELVQLDGLRSSDLEGAPLTYLWTVIETPPDVAVTLADPTAARPTFRVPSNGEDPLYQQEGLYRFQLVVSDGQTKSASDEVDIHVRIETRFETELLVLINKARTEGNTQAKSDGVKETSIAPLVLHAALVRAARTYSRTLFVNGGVESVDRNGRTPTDRAREEGYLLKRIGENIALIKSKTPIRLTTKRVRGIIDGWLASVEHKKNLMRGEFTDTGIGFFSGRFAPGEYRIYTVQVFGIPKSDVLDGAANKDNPLPPPLPKPLGKE
ncbi:hypothetical protein HY624_02000 [Candidatus Uhrbacteria bacterium]|nr:hypothetical protein [Candidatus Uhrbacteria bacterium]